MNAAPSIHPPADRPTEADQSAIAPDFELSDQIGRPFRLSQNLEPAGVLLVFYRGHWCPYCRRYLCKLQANLSRLTSGGTRLVAISPEPPATSLFLSQELGLEFPLLSDSDGRVIENYGSRNGFLGTGSVLPHPSVFVIDRTQAIRFRSIDRNFKKRTTVRTILYAISESQRSGAS